MKMVFAGFRHPHIFSLYRRAEAIGACEPDPAARAAAEAQGVKFTHSTYEELMKTPGVEAVAVGDCYARRGEIIKTALQKGLHVIGDKPLCTSLCELNQIEDIACKTHLKIGCMFDLRTTPNVLKARELIRDGAVGEIESIQFNGQHPLNYGSRAGWYFEPGMHGGIINDLAIHAFDLIPFMTGQEIVEAAAARVYHIHLPEAPNFQNGGQLMLILENGAGVSGDVSYTAPSHIQYVPDSYWRFTVSGSKGMLEFNYRTPEIVLMKSGEKQPEIIATKIVEISDYFDDFLNGLSTARVLRASRQALLTQQAAEQRTRIKL